MTHAPAIRHHRFTDPLSALSMERWTAVTPERIIAAELTVALAPHDDTSDDQQVCVIHRLYTFEDYRRRGYAKVLYDAACAEMTVLHAPKPWITEQGTLFAEAVGGLTADSELASMLLPPHDHSGSGPF